MTDNSTVTSSSVDKIRKLVALASNNPNKHEAAAALNRVLVFAQRYKTAVATTSSRQEYDRLLDDITMMNAILEKYRKT